LAEGTGSSMTSVSILLSVFLSLKSSYSTPLGSEEAAGRAGHCDWRGGGSHVGAEGQAPLHHGRHQGNPEVTYKTHSHLHVLKGTAA